MPKVVHADGVTMSIDVSTLLDELSLKECVERLKVLCVSLTIPKRLLIDELAKVTLNDNLYDAINHLSQTNGRNCSYITMERYLQKVCGYLKIPHYEKRNSQEIRIRILQAIVQRYHEKYGFLNNTDAS
jgi:hypothetical protein